MASVGYTIQPTHNTQAFKKQGHTHSHKQKPRHEMLSSECVFPGEEFHARLPACVSKLKMHPEIYFPQQAHGQARPIWLLLGATVPSIRHACAQKAVFLPFFMAAGDSIKGAFSQCLTVTEPSCSPALSLEIYRDRKSFAGNPRGPALRLQSGSFRRQCATGDRLVNWIFPPWPHATKPRPGNDQAQRGREKVPAYSCGPFHKAGCLPREC